MGHDYYGSNFSCWNHDHQVNSPTYYLREQLIGELIPKCISEGTALDVGCGTGEYVIRLLERGYNVDAFDSSEYAIRHALKAIPKVYSGKVRIFVADIEKLPIKKKYDLIIVVEVLEHVKEDRKALTTLLEMLNENGTIIISVPYDPCLWSSNDEFSGHLRRYKKDQLPEILASHGLRVERVLCYGFPMLRVFWSLLKRLSTRESIFASTNRQSSTVRNVIWRMGISVFDALLLILDRNLVFTSLGVGLIVVAKK